MISNEQLEKAKEHALAEFPKESVGIVINGEAGQLYLPCENIDDDPLQGWTLPGDALADAEDRGEIVAIIHSHPNGTPRASDVDRLSCEAAGVPYGIISLGGDPINFGNTGWITPCGWEAPLVGREFHYGVLDCYTLIRDWYKREKGIELPHFDHGKDQWWNPDHPNYMPDFNPYMDHFEEAGFVPASGEIQVGDIFLMQIRANVPNHAGVYIGDGVMLHHVYNRLSQRVVYGGMWQECTRTIIRRGA